MKQPPKQTSEMKRGKWTSLRGRDDLHNFVGGNQVRLIHTFTHLVVLHNITYRESSGVGQYFFVARKRHDRRGRLFRKTLIIHYVDFSNYLYYDARPPFLLLPSRTLRFVSERSTLWRHSRIFKNGCQTGLVLFRYYGLLASSNCPGTQHPSGDSR